MTARQVWVVEGRRNRAGKPELWRVQSALYSLTRAREKLKLYSAGNPRFVFRIVKYVPVVST